MFTSTSLVRKHSTLSGSKAAGIHRKGTLMTTSAERVISRLAAKRHPNSTEEANRIARAIKELDSIDPSFSATAEKLIASGGYASERAIVLWLGSEQRFIKAVYESEDISVSSGIVYTAAQYVLDEVALYSSVRRLAVDFMSWEYARNGYRLLLKSGYHPQPSLPTRSDREIDSYGHPLAVAAVIHKDRTRNFPENATSFMAWASGQPDLNTVLQVALRTGSTDPDIITSFMGLQKESPTALHSGLL